MTVPQTQGTKRAAPAPDSSNPPDQAAKRFKKRKFNSHAIRKIGYNFEIPAAIANVRTKTDQPFNVGMALGVMLYYIVPLISSHLDNAIDYHNKVPQALQWVTGFVEAIDQYIAYLRLTDGCSEKFPDDTTVDRKSRRPRRKYMERYIHLVENAYKEHVREQLCDDSSPGPKSRRSSSTRALTKLSLEYSGSFTPGRMLFWQLATMSGRFGCAGSARNWHA
jgi:hypothetical protein